jgi:hypothetical protein
MFIAVIQELMYAIDCKAPMASKDWKPDWVKERRRPTFVEGPSTLLPEIPRCWNDYGINVCL